MGMNTNEINSSCEKLEQTFNELDVKFGKIDLNDEDVNYLINFSTSNAKLFSIKALNTIEALVFIEPENSSLNFMALNVYQIKNAKKLNYYYEIVNDVNGIINHGKFTIHKAPYRIIYRAVIDYDSSFDIFSKELFKSILDDFLENLSILYIIMKRRDIDNNV